MTTTREVVNQLKALLPEKREEDAEAALAIGIELVGRAIIALEDIAHHLATVPAEHETADAKPESPTPVYSHPGCVFNYCPHPDLCRDHPQGCTQAPR